MPLIQFFRPSKKELSAAPRLFCKNIRSIGIIECALTRYWCLFLCGFATLKTPGLLGKNFPCNFGLLLYPNPRSSEVSCGVSKTSLYNKSTLWWSNCINNQAKNSLAIKELRKMRSFRITAVRAILGVFPLLRSLL